jgi:hypothetical protein
MPQSQLWRYCGSIALAVISMLLVAWLARWPWTALSNLRWKEMLWKTVFCAFLIVVSFLLAKVSHDHRHEFVSVASLIMFFVGSFGGCMFLIVALFACDVALPTRRNAEKDRLPKSDSI